MSRSTTGFAISYAAELSSDDEDCATNIIQSCEVPTMPNSNSNVENAVTQKRRGRPPAGGKNLEDVEPLSSRTRRASGGSKLGAKRAAVEKRTGRSRRPALKEIKNVQEVKEVEEADDFDVLSDANVPSIPQLVSPVAPHQAPKEEPAAKTVKPATKPITRKGRTPLLAQGEIKEIPETQEDVVVQSKLARTKSAAVKKPRPAKREIIPETQPMPMEIEETSPVGQEPERIEEPTPKVIKVTNQRAPSIIKQYRAPSAQRRGGSASDTERHTNEPALRRKVGDLTKKLEALELKYNTLRDLGVDDAETAFDKLKQQVDEKTKATNELIASLRADVKAQTSLAAESNTLRAQVASLTASNAALTTEKKTFQSSLQDSQSEIKSLQAKLTAARASAASIQSTETSRALGSAVKGNYGAQRTTVLVGSVEAAKEAQKRVLKEELYSDLTGLIVRDVKRKEEKGEDVYDCIQTGRNGTLHFHLTIPFLSTSTSNATTTPHHHPSTTNQTTSYDDAEFQYTPLLDASRDIALLDILPDYLTEEICFPRSNAGKFYARVVDCLTKRIVVEEEEEGEEEMDEGGEEGEMNMGE